MAELNLFHLVPEYPISGSGISRVCRDEDAFLKKRMCRGIGGILPRPLEPGREWI